jgi:cytochrome c oxidase subunit II
MSAVGEHDEGAERAERTERRWASVSVVVIATLVVVAAFAGIYHATMPQFHVETVNPRTLHLTGEFIESNLGSALEPDGSVTVRTIGQQYSFTPQCILVPTATQINVRGTSADVVHGFLIDGTNVNTMLVPGYVSTITMRFDSPGEHHMPCHEYCSVGHEGMWGKIVVINRQEFLQRAATRRRLDCVK